MKKNYIPKSVSFSDGFNGPRGNVGFVMIYDDEKAKSIINNLITEGRNIEFAEAGLDGDFMCCSSVIYKDGVFKEPEFYDRSVWATPILMVYFSDAPSECYEVWSK